MSKDEKYRSCIMISILITFISFVFLTEAGLLKFMDKWSYWLIAPIFIIVAFILGFVLSLIFIPEKNKTK